MCCFPIFWKNTRIERLIYKAADAHFCKNKHQGYKISLLRKRGVYRKQSSVIRGLPKLTKYFDARSYFKRKQSFLIEEEINNIN